MSLPDFPTDPASLDLISAALEPGPDCTTCVAGTINPDGDLCPECNGRGAHGGSLWGALDLLSGIDRADRSQLEDLGGGVSFDPRPQYVPNDVIRSLIAALRRERYNAASASPAPTPHTWRPVVLSAASGALLGAVIGWLAAGRRG